MPEETYCGRVMVSAAVVGPDGYRSLYGRNLQAGTAKTSLMTDGVVFEGDDYLTGRRQILFVPYGRLEAFTVDAPQDMAYFSKPKAAQEEDEG